MNEPAPSPHPSVEKLRTFGLGQLDAREASAVEEHVAHCPACCRTLAEVGPDTLVDLLRTTRKFPEVGHESATVALTHWSEEAMRDLPRSGGSTSAERGEDLAPVGLPPELANHPRYRVLALLGSGGMGTVYKAEHRLMERPVALKVMAAGLLGSPAMVERFRREVKAAARLSHPNIVTAHDAEQAGELHLLVMEYVEGIDLARLVSQRGPLPAAEACGYVRQVAAGLQHAHEHGMIHRDIKPHNLMLTPHGVVKILDFGLARLTGDAATQPGGATSRGVVLGTVDYLAPEQADDAHRADIRSDIYSLGCTLYHLLSGCPPFPTGTLVQKIMAHTQRQPQSLLELRPDLPPGLVRIVERMMAKPPGRRYQTPAEVQAALEPFCRADATVALAEPPARPSPRLPCHSAAGERTERVALPRRRSPREEVILDALPVQPHRRRRWPIALALFFPLLAGLIVAGVAVYRIQTDNGELVIRTDNPDVEVVIKQNSKVVRIIDTKTNKEVKLDSGLYELELKDKAEGLKLTPDKFTLRRGETVVARVEWLRRQEKPAEKVGEVRRFPDGDWSVSFSPDGRQIVTGGGPHIHIWDVSSGKKVRSFDYGCWSVVFSPDGKSLLIGAGGRPVQIINAVTGQVLRELEANAGRVRNVAFSHNGRLIASSHGDGQLRLWDAATGEELHAFPAHNDPVHSAAFTPDDKLLLVINPDNSLRLYEVDTGKEVRKFEGHTDTINEVAISSDGRRALSGSADKTLRVWDVQTGKELRKLEGHTDIVHSIAFCPDGRGLSGSVDKTIRLWDLQTGKELHRFEGPTEKVVCVAVSPDGRHALSGSGDLVVRLWRLPAPVPADKGR